MSRKRTIEWFVEQKQVIIAPGNVFPLSWDDLVTMWPDNQCYLVALTERQLNVIHSALSLAYYHKSFWGLPHRSAWQQSDVDRWDTIHAFVAGLENCLMSGCNVSDLIAAIDAQTDALTAGLNAVNVLALDTIRDTLSNWQVQDNTDQVARNTQLSAINTEMDAQTALNTNRNDRLGDINASMGIVGDRIAPNGSDVFTGLTTINSTLVKLEKELSECCARAIPVDPVLNDTSIILPDALKCTRSAVMVGQSEDFLNSTETIVDNISIGTAIIVIPILVEIGVLPLTIGALVVSAATAATIVDAISDLVIGSEFTQLVTWWRLNKPALHQALYEADSTLSAETAVLAVIAASTLSAPQQIVANLVASGLYYDGLFGNDYWYDFLENPYFEFFAYLGNWYTGDCTEYINPSGTGEPPVNFCDPPLTAPDAVVNFGTPTAIFETDGTLNTTSQTFASVLDGSTHTVEISLLGEYDVTITSVSRALDIDVGNCDVASGYCQGTTTTIDPPPFTIQCQKIKLQTNDGAFTVSLDFNQNTPDWTFGCY